MNERMTSAFRLAACAILLSAAVAGAAETRETAAASMVRESVEVSNHHVFNTSNVVDGATVLIRNFRDDVVEATVSTRALEPEVAYSIWWAIFNRPQYCVIPYECGLPDLEINGGDPRVRVSVFWGGGLVADMSGTANHSVRLLPGRTDRELFANSKNYGLIDIRRAEIHLVLRTHGPAGIAGTVGEQVGSAFLACPSSGCVNAFASIHRPGESVVSP
jgi:hypothetical protein